MDDVPAIRPGGRSPHFSRGLDETMSRALALANARQHEYATLEHLLLALISDLDASAVLKACNVDLDKLARSLIGYIESELDNLFVNGEPDAKPSAGFQRVIQRAIVHLQSAGRVVEVTGADILPSIFAERESHAAYFLQEQDMSRFDAVNFISHGIAKNPAFAESRPRRKLLVISNEKDRALEDWLRAVLTSAGFTSELFRNTVRSGERIQKAMSQVLNKSYSDSHVVSIMTPRFRKLPVYGILEKEAVFRSLTTGRNFIPLVVGPRISTLPLADVPQVILSDISAEDACAQIFLALDYQGKYECFAEQLELALHGSRKQGDDGGKSRTKVVRSESKFPLPGEDDFTWHGGVILQSEFPALELKTGDAILKPGAFLKDYTRLILELAEQVVESNHSFYVKGQSKLLLEEVRLGPNKWDPQTIDRRVRALMRLLPTDEAPMNRLIELNFHELKQYQSHFRAIYPIVADRDRAMRAFKVPEAAPIVETRQIAKALRNEPELVDAEVPHKLESAIKEILEIEGAHEFSSNGVSIAPSDGEKKRVIFKLAIILNSVWKRLKDPPDLVRKIESYRKLYELSVPIFQKILEWISHF
jgi:hypothetical protein